MKQDGRFCGELTACRARQPTVGWGLAVPGALDPCPLLSKSPESACVPRWLPELQPARPHSRHEEGDRGGVLFSSRTAPEGASCRPAGQNRVTWSGGLGNAVCGVGSPGTPTSGDRVLQDQPFFLLGGTAATHSPTRTLDKQKCVRTWPDALGGPVTAAVSLCSGGRGRDRPGEAWRRPVCRFLLPLRPRQRQRRGNRRGCPRVPS